jgi:peptide/nickel transport system permease protein
LVAYILRRFIRTIFIIIVVTILTFLLLQLVPGDVAVATLGADASKAQLDSLRHELLLDKPIMVQYFHWLSNAVRGDLGKSVVKNDKVSKLIVKRLPITLYLSSIAIILTSFLGILAGTICAVRRGSLLDSFITLLANLGVAVPVFWLGILSIYYLGLELKLLPIQGFTWPSEDLRLSIRQSILPIFCLAIPPLATIARQTRSSMLEVVNQDYIRTARSKGLAEQVIISKHALKNALIPVITLLGLQVRMLVGGSVLVETVFNIPGMGRLMVEAAFNKDFFLLQGGVLLIGLAVCLANLAVDISYGWFDPRIRYG